MKWTKSIKFNSIFIVECEEWKNKWIKWENDVEMLLNK